MAQTASAASVITTIVLKLSEILYNEVTFLLDVPDGVQRLRRELRWMQSFLKDAENKLDDSNLVRTWVSDVRDLAYEAEDVIDTFILKQGPDTDRSNKCSHCFYFTKKVPTTHELGCQLERLTAKANDISLWRERYGLINTDVGNPSKSQEKLKEMRESSSYANNDFVVGLLSETNIVKHEITNGGTKLDVVSILGMGGLGKTTLARKLYTELKDEYSYHAWVCVSQEYKPKEILLRLIKSILNPEKESLEDLTSQDLMEQFLRDGLSGKKFLIVLDDLWNTDDWESIRRFFPKEETHSRIIVTTRIEDVAKVTNGFILSLRMLDENDSWDLFCSRTFPNDTDKRAMSMLQKYGEEMLALGKEMVARCDGLPLAIVTLGSLLSRRSQTVDEWKAVKDNLWKEIGKEGNGTQINAVLSLSFKYLPDHLKLCLLYVGMFPEDYEIPVRSLMLMWEAEGFIEQDEEANAERITKSYFNELVGRSLLLKVNTEDWVGGVYCRVHDLVRDLVIKNAKEIRYSAFYAENQPCFDVRKAQSQRRLAMYDLENTQINYTNRSLRTLHFACRDEEEDSKIYQYLPSTNKFLKSLYLRFPLLRVLHIVIEGKMPDLQMGKLINLRYLYINCFQSVELPETLGDLKYLQTLAVLNQISSMPKLPKTVVKLQNLKHLRGLFKTRRCRIGELTALETLQISDIEDWLELDTAKLGNLRHLHLHNYSRLDGAKTYTSFLQKFNGLKRLQRLSLHGKLPCKISEIFEACRDITHIAFLSNFDSDFGEFASNLQVLEFGVLKDQHFCAVMTSLEKLPKLRALKFQIYTDQHLEYTCSQGGFSKLRTLDIKLLGRDGDITLVGGMPSLINLIGDPLSKLRRLERPEQSTIEES